MHADPEAMIELARNQGADALGTLLEPYRNYLRFLARLELGRHLQAKLDASDLVQETFLEAHRHFDRFEGKSEPQLAHWLRQILAGRVSNQLRHFIGTKGRDVHREQSQTVHIERSSGILERGLVGSITSPSQQASRREQAVIVATAMERLPEDYREVLILRHWEELKFIEIAARMQRSEDSVEKLWLRALAKLKKEMGKSE